MATVFDWDCNGLVDAVVVVGAVEVGSITTLTALVGGSIMEYNGLSSARLDTSGTTGVDAFLSPNIGNAGTFDVTATIGGAGSQSQIILIFRTNAAGNFHALTIDNGTTGISITKYVASVVDSVLVSHATGYVAGTTYQFRLVVVGNTFTVFRDGTQVMTVTDTSYASNFAHELILFNSSNAAQTLLGRITIDDQAKFPSGGWGGGSFGPSLTPFRSAYTSRARTALVNSERARTVALAGYFGESVAASDPLYIGAAGSGTVYLGATAAATKYLGARTLF